MVTRVDPFEEISLQGLRPRECSKIVAELHHAINIVGAVPGVPQLARESSLRGNGLISAKE